MNTISVAPYRRITVQDVDPESFRVFLQYLYGISLKLASVQVEELVDLLAIADRCGYVVSTNTVYYKFHFMIVALGLLNRSSGLRRPLCACSVNLNWLAELRAPTSSCCCR